MIKSKRLAEAAFFARAYCPSQVSTVVKAWEEQLKAKKMPYEPEDIGSGKNGGEVMELAKRIERQIKESLAGERPSAESYEQALQDYFRDLTVVEPA